MLTRRKLGLSAGALALTACSQTQNSATAAESKMTEISQTANVDWANLSEREWRERLTDMEFRVLRQEATERPFSSPLNENKAAGTYACAGCGLPLFKSDKKFDSGTGWPSFFDVIETVNSSSHARNITANAATVTKAMSLKTAPPQRDCAIAIMAWRWILLKLKRF